MSAVVRQTFTRRIVAAWAAAAAMMFCAEPAYAQNCLGPITNANRLILVTTVAMNVSEATMRLYTRASSREPWQALGPPEPALVGKAGMGWSWHFRRLARAGEPVKVEGDKRTPAGVYTVGRSFGTLASSRPNHLQITPDTVCVDDLASPAYNTITSRALVGPKVGAENMSELMPMYRRGLLIEYPTDAKRRAGSCIFIHVWRSPASATEGCVAVPESRMEMLQDFAAGGGAVVAILPRRALDRLRGCLPDIATGSPKI
jgi:L,D-peptidoglycan transpeptidase YkuD (ErfK/YbiS/YcfS/YnhG family)